MSPSPDAWTFERFTPGAPVGEARLALDETLLAQWRAVYPELAHDGPAVPPSLLMPVFMRLYANAVAPRPPGNIHAGQVLTLARLPLAGATVESVFRCADKALRKGRRFVASEGVVSDGAGECFRGRITTIWAV